MARHLPPLNALRFFEAAARHHSFVRAAEELHVTPAAVSQQIKLLEEYLGVTLFKRGKSLALNESAKDALHLISDAFDQLERAMLRVRSGSIAGPLTISAPPAFASRWIIPRLHDFYARYPDVEIHLLATRRVVDFFHGRSRHGHSLWQRRPSRIERGTPDAGNDRPGGCTQGGKIHQDACRSGTGKTH